MDTKQYKKLKDAGNVTIARLHENLAVVNYKQFDIHDGKPAEPVVEQYNIEELQKQRDSAAAHLAALDTFLADLRASPVLAPVATDAPRTPKP